MGVRREEGEGKREGKTERRGRLTGGRGAEGKEEEGEGRRGREKGGHNCLTCRGWREGEPGPQGSQSWLQETDKVGEKDS